MVGEQLRGLRSEGDEERLPIAVHLVTQEFLYHRGQKVREVSGVSFIIYHSEV